MYQGSFDSTQCEKLKEYIPIPWGGLKMLAGTINVLVLLAGSVALWFFLSMSFSDSMLGLGISTIPISVIGVYFTTGARREWIKSYFRRNGAGYFARFWIPEKATDGTKWFCDIIVSSGDEVPDSEHKHLGGIEIEVPLGGWFNKLFCGSCILVNGELREKDYLLNWSVRTRPVGNYPGHIIVELRYRDKSFVDDRIQLTIEDAIYVINIRLARPAVSLSGVLRHYIGECQRLTDENSLLAVDRRDVDELIRGVNQNRDSCMRALHDLDSTISQTDRLKDTVEGLTVWEKVLDAIYHYGESADPIHIESVSCQLALVRRKLDELKRGSSRRRGKVAAS